jgi:uncharacterized protein YcfJ
MDKRSCFFGSTPFLVAALAAMLAMPAYGQSESECAARADRAARDSTGVAVGAVRGGLGGAAFGAIVGGNSRGAARGAAVGAVVGGAVGANNRNEVYKRVYDDCMRGRG